MKKVTKIEGSGPSKEAKQKLRVAAYCRVSTDTDAQLESLETQKSHYETYIASRDDWSLAGIYFDEGITGTKKEKRPELLHMMQDCRAGKIDLIVTKSISRFSRNTTDCLELVRALQELRIPVLFEKEGINTGSMDSELLLSILSSMAEDESVSISQNNKWGIKQRFRNGTFKISCPPYGYDWNGEQMIINPAQAKVVRRIYRELLSGKGTSAVARELASENIPTRRGGKWSPSQIKQIVSNEKYTGDCIFQKTFTDDAFNRHRNKGEKERFLMKDHHEPIISHEDFDAVQNLIAQHAREKRIKKGTGKYQSRYPFSGKIICGNCGSTFKRVTHYYSGGSYIVWACNMHIKDKERCTMKTISDDSIKYAFTTMMNKLIYSHRIILKPLVKALQDSTDDAALAKIQRLKTELSRLDDQRKTMQTLMAQKYIDQIFFNKENNQLLSQSEQMKKKIEQLTTSNEGDTAKLSQGTALLHFTEKGQMLDAFDDELFQRFVDRVIVLSRNEISFKLRCGLTLKEAIR